MALVAVGVGLYAGEHDAQCLLVAVRLVQRVAPIFAPAGLPIVAAQHCDTTHYLIDQDTRMIVITAGTPAPDTNTM